MQPPGYNLIDGGICTGVRKCLNMGKMRWQLVDAVQVGVEPTDDGPIYNGQVFGSNGKVIHAAKTFSIRLHQKYYLEVYQNLLKLKSKQETRRAQG